MYFLHFHKRDLDHTELPVYSVQAHDQIINCIDGAGGIGINCGAPEIATGSRDGKFSLYLLFLFFNFFFFFHKF